MLAHLLAVYPEEGCGLLAGYSSDGVATAVYPIENIASTPQTRFLMAPQSQLDAFLDIETAELDLLAIYHSHPHGPDTPSATDMAQAYYPDLTQIIVSLAQTRPGARAFRVTQTDFHEIVLLVE
jgi:proteasome lid subunit RPN8/RPN11